MGDNAFKPVDLDSINTEASAFAPISLEQLEIIKNAPPAKRGGQSKKERLWATRTNQNWFQLPTHNAECFFCEHSHMCTETPDGKLICRRCYIPSNDKLPIDERVVHEWPLPIP